MRFLKVWCSALIAVLAGGCGTNAGSTATTQSIKFVPPSINSQQTYMYTLMDNLSTARKSLTRNTVTAVNPDGSFTYIRDTPNNNAVPNQTVIANKFGQIVSMSTAGSTCIFSPHADGPDFPITVGQTWTNQFTVTCGTQTPIPQTETGAVVDIESVTVPAGSFWAIKLKSALVTNNSNGTSQTQEITKWVDVNTDVLLKTVVNFSYSENYTLSQSYPATTTIELQSQL